MKEKCFIMKEYIGPFIHHLFVTPFYTFKASFTHIVSHPHQNAHIYILHTSLWHACFVLATHVHV